MTFKKVSFSVSSLTIGVIMLIMTVVSTNLHWYKDHWKTVLGADAKGYYAYLPAVFIYKDLNFGFFEQIEEGKYYDEHLYYNYRSMSNGKVINKYYCGTAVAELPFFLTAHAVSTSMGYDSDGYSKIYMLFIKIAALFYLLAGLLYLRALLRRYSISERNIAITLGAIVFGTNLFYYTVVEGGLSHIYSFTFITMFAYYAKRYFELLSGKYLVLLGILLGLIVLIRPVNGLVVLILPFMAGEWGTFKEGLSVLLRNKLRLLFASVFFVLIVSIQLIIYKISTGSFMVYSYGEEGFNFLSPHFFEILFSYRKGLFLYTPMYLLALTGLYFLWKKSRFSSLIWLGFFVILTYVFSSWWNWWYGGSFSSRVYVEFLALFAVLLAIALDEIKGRFRYGSFLMVMLLLIVVCQIQTYQYRYYYIHWEHMTKEQYWNVFLRVDKFM